MPKVFRCANVLLVSCLCWSLSYGSDDANEEAEPDFVLQFREIKEDAERKLASIYEKVEGRLDPTKGREEQQELIDLVQSQTEEIILTATDEVFELIEPYATEAGAAEPLAWIARIRSTKEIGHAAIELLKEHHLVRSETIELSKILARSQHPLGISLLKLQFESSNLPEEHRPKVMFSIARIAKTRAELSSRLAEATDEQLERYSSYLGKEQINELQLANTEELEEEAVRLFQEIELKYPDQETKSGVKLGDLSKSAVFEIRNLRVGKVVPDIVGEDLEGETFRLSDYRGKVVLLCFWATWCGPCMADIPHERDLVEMYQGKPFAVVGVNSDLNREEIRPALEKHRISWRSFWCGPEGPTGRIPTEWHVLSWPTVYLIDHEGVIQGKKLTRDKLDEKISELVSKAVRVAKK